MSIKRKVKAVERLFEHLDREISAFQTNSGLHCVAGCGKCCTKPDIEASPLEFLPYAFQLFLNGKAEQTLEELRQAGPVCYIYQPLSLTDNQSGSCGSYQYRGLICRLFGYAATRNKLGQLQMATCKVIKEGQQINYSKAVENVSNGLKLPVFSNYYTRLAQIDYHLGNKMAPINQALKLSLEEVINYYAYRPYPRGIKRKSLF
ncbi:MAG: YkgJ family cysteine cluster protein [Cyclobacteriaceae bacterium]|nr:YkgJ family cysteine cluster protein [Cyclobacteriaceae bacterium]